MRERHAALVVVGTWPISAHSTGKRPLSIGVRRCGNVPAAASTAKPAPLRGTRAQELAVSGGRGASLELAACACHAALAVVGQCAARQHCAAERPLSDARPWCNKPAAMSNPKPAPLITQRAHGARRRSLSLERDAPLEFAVRTRHAALVVVDLCAVKERCAGERPLSFGARLWCNVPAAASGAKPAPAVTRARTRAQAPALTISGGKAQYSSLLCVRAMSRFLRWSVSYRRALRWQEASL